MSGREWCDGDVAMVTHKGGTLERRSFRRGHGWICDIGEILDAYAAKIRPLVVIDPKDRDEVQRLANVINKHDTHTDECEWVDDLAAALREFANPKPPKPEEPTGLGAVVEDEGGKFWVRSADDDCRNPWEQANNFESVEWSEIAVVRVLSEGVQAGDPR